MLKLPDKNTVFFDVDGTLVLWETDCTPELLEAEGIHFDRQVQKNIIKEMMVPHRVHIELLKEFKQKGKVVVVWSQGGSDWAETVVKTLGLEEFVDLVVSKPHWWVDDVHTGYFMPSSSRIWKPYAGSDDT